jgi:hypothetical protein
MAEKKEKKAEKVAEKTTEKPAEKPAETPAVAKAEATDAPAAKPAKSDDFSASFEAKKRGKPVKQNVTDPEELSIDFEEDGKIVRKGIKKEILSKGAWTTVAYLFQDLNRKKNEFGNPKVSITRYKKVNKIYQFQKEFTLSSSVQAKQFIDAIQKWITDGSLPVSAEGEEEG